MFPSPIGELHFSIIICLYHSTKCIRRFRPLSGSYISQSSEKETVTTWGSIVSVPYRGATFLNKQLKSSALHRKMVSVPYRGATFLNQQEHNLLSNKKAFPSPIGELHFSIGSKGLKRNYGKVSVPYRGATFLNFLNTDGSMKRWAVSFRPLSGSYISQYHPRNPMSCLGRIGGLRGKSNFIEMQPFWKVKNSHKSNI